MKKNQALATSAFVLLFGLLCSCRSMNYLTMNAVEPAPVYLPAEIKHVGVLDQSLPDDKNKFDKLDKILSIEGKNLDKDAAHAAVLGLSDELGKNNRLSEVKIIEDASIKSPGMGIFPAPLTWDKVQQICYDNKVDALFMLCFYDTDAQVDYQAIPIELTGPLGVKIPAVEHQATMRTQIKMGWRIYDPTSKTMLDEYPVHENIVLSGRGINPLKAAEAIMGRKEAIVQASNQIGQNYAYRIVPYSIRVRREYYVRGTGNFKIAKRRAQTGNWDSAAELWKKETENANPKVAGRATYNMAIINEINGDLKKAIEWASKSYTDYNNKKALAYINVLKNRLAKNNQLERENGQ